jgi:CubicO group peptidase (beta-lactamase class C family)
LAPLWRWVSAALEFHAGRVRAARTLGHVNTALQISLDRVADETGFSGVVHVSRGGELLYERACGLAHRAHGVANTPTTRFGIASGSKGFTALTIMSLIAEGSLALDTSVRSLLGDELELIDAAVTVGHLLAHTSGIGDYIDEDALGDIDDYVLPVPVHQLADTTDYLAVLRGHPAKFEPGQRFAYSNSGFVVLALVAEAVSGASFHELVAERVFARAGMTATGFPRSDELSGSAAIGYMPTEHGWRTNQLHLPVRGSGDGGAYSTAADVAAFWPALFEGRIVPRPLVDEMVRPHNDAPSQSMRYGLGFWIHPDRATVMLEGHDAGVSFRSAFDPTSELLYTVMSNTSAGAWPIAKLLDGSLPDLARP